MKFRMLLGKLSNVDISFVGKFYTSSSNYGDIPKILNKLLEITSKKWFKKKKKIPPQLLEVYKKNADRWRCRKIPSDFFTEMFVIISICKDSFYNNKNLCKKSDGTFLQHHLSGSFFVGFRMFRTNFLLKALFQFFSSYVFNNLVMTL